MSDAVGNAETAQTSARYDSSVLQAIGHPVAGKASVNEESNRKGLAR